MADANVDKIPGLLKNLFETTAELEAAFPGRSFTPDGHLVGSIGEVLAAHHFGIKLYPASSETHDGETDEVEVQVKATFCKSVGISSEPEHLLVLKLKRDGTFDVVYNGPGDRVWALFKDKKLPKNGQYAVSISRLRALMIDVEADKQIKRKTAGVAT